MTTTRTKIILEVDGLVEVADEGYLGTEATVREHIDKARRDVTNWRWLVKKGGLDPEPVHLKVTVKEVHINPGDDL